MRRRRTFRRSRRVFGRSRFKRRRRSSFRRGGAPRIGYRM